MFTSGRIIDLVRESFRLQLVGELPELVEIDARPEAEGMRNRFWRWMTLGNGRFTQADTDRPIDRFLEGDAKFPRAPL